MVWAIDGISRTPEERALRQALGRDVPKEVMPPGRPPGMAPGGNYAPKTSSGFFLWRYTKYFFKFVWGTLLTFALLPLVVLMWLPWAWLNICRPSLYNPNGTSKEKAQYRAGDDGMRALEKRELWSLPGNGIENRWPRGFRNRFWPFWKGRTWQLYELLRGCWRSVNRQGLQVGGVVCGMIIVAFQIEIMAFDLRSDSIAKFYDAYFGGSDSEDPHAFLIEGDVMCGYVVGTGIANWGDGLQNIVWFLLYHYGLFLLAVMLIVDEGLNIRFGCMSPQWSRAGNGYTVMFLAAATICTSPNWGWKAAIRFRYVTLFCIFIFGVYNVLRTFIVSFNLTHHTYANQTYRHRRHALRPWKEIEWQYAKHIQDFRARSDIEVPRHWSERKQLAIGDHFRQWQKIDRKKWDYGKTQKRAQKVYIKTPQEHEQERGQASRKFVHGLPLAGWPPMTAQDEEDMKRKSRMKYYANYYGHPSWDPFAKYKRVPKNDKEAEEMKIERSNYNFARYLLWFFNIRRVHAVACALGVFGIHVGLLIDACANSHFSSYRAEYNKASTTWKDNWGPIDSDCQYFSGSHMPLLVQMGTSDLKGVFATLFWILIWHTFMMGMCLGVALVAFTNNRALGMMLPVPITLIGPRLSSNGVGWTLGFVSLGTLQLALFPSYPPIVGGVCRFILFNSIANWVVHLFPNYHLGNNRCIHTFWFAFNHEVYKYMDTYKWHEQVYDHATY